MVTFTDYENAEGAVDWKAYRQAKVAAGEACRQCGASQFLGAAGYPRRCSSCESLVGNQEEVTHKQFVRCPHCSHQERPEEYDLHGEELDVCCGSCDRDYTVAINVSVSFTSPPIGGSFDNDN